MDTGKRRRLEAAGWKFGDAGEFLALTPEEREYVDLKLALSNYLRDLRRQSGWTQIQLATRLGSSQSRVAKMEAADSSVTVDLLLRSLLAVGATHEDLGRVIGAA